MMITRCPECATAFRVTGEQLAARDGKVRCGRCREVFDARACLEVSTDDDADRAPVREQALVAGQSAATATPVPEASPPSVPPTPPLAGEAGMPTSAGKVSAPSLPPREMQESQPAAPTGPDPEEAIVASPLPQPYASSDETYEFEFGKRPRSRAAVWGWSLASLVLLLALFGQVLFYFRGEVALLLPQTAPYLHALCADLGCDIPLPRRAELMSIETSELESDPQRPGVMILAATLRNRAAFPQEYPALELTLTNERDQPLARRVLTPRDYLRREPEGGIAPAAEHQVRLHIEAASLNASGYRLYLFYP